MTDRDDRPSFTGAQVAAFRLQRHHLDVRAPRNRLPAVVGDVCGVQTQVTALSRIALWARLRGLTANDVERSLLRERTIVKTWSLRGALHLHPANELLVYLAGLMPTRLAREQRWIHGAGLKEEETTAMVMDALKNGPLTRRQLAENLAKRLGPKTKDWADGGWGRKTVGSTLAWYLVRPALVRGLVCFGLSEGQEVSFTRLDRWLRKQLSMPEEAEAEEALVRRYFHSFGPASAQDLRAWSSVYVRRLVSIMQRLGDELVEADVDGIPGFVLRKDVPGIERVDIDHEVVRLLPSFDPFMLGHRERGYLVDRAHYHQVYKEAGWLASVVLLDGRVAGTWSYQRRPGRIGVDVKMFRTVNKDIRKKMKEEAEDLARFLEVPVIDLRVT